jgi:hypothetical protein
MILAARTDAERLKSTVLRVYTKEWPSCVANQESIRDALEIERDS